MIDRRQAISARSKTTAGTRPASGGLRPARRDVQVLSTVPVMFCYWAKPEHGHDLARILNDHIAEVVPDASRPLRRPGHAADAGTGPRHRGNGALRPRAGPARRPRSARTSTIGTSTMPPCFRSARRRSAGGGGVRPSVGHARPRPHGQVLAAVAGGDAGGNGAGDLLGSSSAACWSGCRGCGSPSPTAAARFPAPSAVSNTASDVRPDLCAVDNANIRAHYLGKFYLDSLVHDADALRGLIRLVGAERDGPGQRLSLSAGRNEPGRLIESLTDLPPPRRRAPAGRHGAGVPGRSAIVHEAGTS